MFLENGLLPHVPGERIFQGAHQLPIAGPDHEAEPVQRVVVPAVQDLGDVRITYELNSYRRGRSRMWHWVAVHAEVA